MKTTMIIFALVFLAQWWIPAKTIYDKQRVLDRGTGFKFLTEPVDPSNPFKGKYITLRYKAESYSMTSEPWWKYNQALYAIFEEDSVGFAQVKRLDVKEPSNEINYCKAMIRFVSSEDRATVIHLYFPFDEYYMEESKAPRAEAIYRESLSDTLSRTFALVNIYKGDAVIRDVFVKNKPI